ncbi:AraC family transcriptional regulator [Halarcobacter sp.]|uniref:helix-turn-helix transcriptional regulator n=1 Tax=Halarcobacter sp. TaxID=2321133 RepID=UPI002AA7BCDE|nr:AraC family transcriptional regulator [Halarcobacter sp.]
MQTAIFKHKALPFIELRYVKNIPECSKMHLHKELTITAIKQGQLNIILNENNFLLNINELAIINKDVVHCATVEKPSQDGYVLYLDPQFLIENELSSFSSFKHIKEKKLYEKFIIFCDELFDTQISIREKMELLYLFCLEVFTLSISKEEDKKDTLSDKIKSFIDENYLEDISLEQLVEKFQMSEIHLIRIFKKSFGLPIHSYIINKRVHKAKELLLLKLPIVDVALKSGFFDQSHLNRSFKRVFQITPKQFQKNIFDKC